MAAEKPDSRAERLKALRLLIQPVIQFIPEERLLEPTRGLHSRWSRGIKVGHVVHPDPTIGEVDIVFGDSDNSDHFPDPTIHFYRKDCPKDGPGWARERCKDADLEALPEETLIAITIAVSIELRSLIHLLDATKAQVLEIMTKLQ